MRVPIVSGSVNKQFNFNNNQTNYNNINNSPDFVKFGTSNKKTLAETVLSMLKMSFVKTTQILPLKENSFFLTELLKLKSAQKNSIMIFKPTGELIAKDIKPNHRNDKLISGNIVVMNYENEPVQLGQVLTLLKLKASKIFNSAGDVNEVITMPKDITTEVIENADKIYKGPVEEDLNVISTDNSLAYMEEIHRLLFNARFSPEMMAKYSEKMGINYQIVK